jgi:hypothetical protein
MIAPTVCPEALFDGPGAATAGALLSWSPSLSGCATTAVVGARGAIGLLLFTVTALIDISHSPSSAQ